jgi:hypothetical protein
LSKKMATRFNAFNNGNTPTGYDKNVATEEFLPSCGVEDVDSSLFNLFNKEIPFIVGSTREGTKKVPVIFATGEKWAILKRNEPMRDSTNTLILPLITILRDGISQSLVDDVSGRGMNQQTGEIVIKRKLSNRDRLHQSTVNRQLIKNQLNVNEGSEKVDGQYVGSQNVIGDMSSDMDVVDGVFFKQNTNNNVIEFITVPTPQFYTATYQVTFWAQYTTHMNQMLETLVSSILPWGQCWRLETEKGYWFVATMDSGEFINKSNFEEVEKERIIKWQFALKVPGYMLASSAPGLPHQIRKYVSSPIVSFDVALDEVNTTGFQQDDPNLGADDPTLPLETSEHVLFKRPDGRRTNAPVGYPNNRTDVAHPNDPALDQLKRGTSPNQYEAYDVYNPLTGKMTRRYKRVSIVNTHASETVHNVDWGEFNLTVVE